MKTSNRRGMLLLVVLAMLALFAMMAVAFVVMTGAYGSSSKKLQLKETQYDPPERLLNLAASNVAIGSYVDPSMTVRGSAPPTSAITWQNLLEKEYGFETIGTLSNPCTLNIANSSSVCNGQLIQFNLPQTNPGVDVYGPNVAVDPFHCVGCVLTMLDGPAAGQSTRIVGVIPNLQNPLLSVVQMLPFEGGLWPTKGNHYIVNGFPYSGMGFGFDTSSGSMTQMALYPNSPPSDWKACGGSNGIIAGGVNADYTAADYTDPLLAMAVPDGSGGVMVPIPSLHRADLLTYLNSPNNGRIMTSTPTLRKAMFRPIGAMNYSDSNGTHSISNPDHPYFTGSNPNFNPLWDGLLRDSNGNLVPWQWDVDNMGTGRPDSVWVDLGFPVRFAADGRAYKPLFAILCLDLDGRLNLNAHGSLAQANSYYYNPQNLQNYLSTSSSSSLNGGAYTMDVGVATATGSASAFAGPVGSTVTKPPLPLPRGQGTGPAEVNLLPLFRTGPTSFNYNSYLALLSGGTINGTAYMGRYGPLLTPPPSSTPNLALPGVNPTGSTPGGSCLTMNNAFPYSGVLGGNYWTNTSAGTLDAYGTPPDPQTIGAYGLDTAGRPLYISLGGQVANGPYDIDLTRNAAHAVDSAPMDDAFSVAEMERILRWSDRDSPALPQRLAALTDAGYGSMLAPRRTEFTVESEYVPVAAAVLPPALRFNSSKHSQFYLQNYRSVHPIDILYAQVTMNMDLTAAQGVQWAQGVAAQLLPWEVIEGLKMDINRPFGAGAFSMSSTGDLNPVYGGAWNASGKSQVLPDQPGMAHETVMQYTASGSAAQQASFNYSADAGAFSKSASLANVIPATPVNDSMAARQLYARHLYVLMLAVADTAAMQNWFNPKADPEGSDGAMKRMLAQWAINVVAYRDHNNIMVPFPYDPNPFGLSGGSKQAGWAPDYTVQHTVWGCKRPELLFTEAIGFHDRRTEDRNDEDYDSTKMSLYPNLTYSRTAAGLTTDPPTSGTEDPSFNSRFRPQGSIFLELFNPWPKTEPRTPDLAFSGGAATGVDLTKVTPATAAGKASPVWRLIIVDPAKQMANVMPPANGDELPDPDNPIIVNRPKIERVAYFVPLTGMNYAAEGQVVYFPSTARSVVVAPGGYAVVGSGDPSPSQNNRTYLGFRTGQTSGDATTRMVTLNPADLTDARVVRNQTDPNPILAPASGGPPIPQVLGIDQAMPNGNSAPNGPTSPQRFSISEPTKGYYRYESVDRPSPAFYNPADGRYYKDQAFGSPLTLDIPVDQQRDVLDKEGVWTNLNTNGTIPAYRIIYLQRLADPTRPYVSEATADPRAWNPYRTVDAMTVDLTCFNGLTTAIDPSQPNGGAASWHFESRQRGERNYLLTGGTAAGIGPGEVNLWKQEPASKAQVGWVGGGLTSSAMNFSASLNQTLGYLNASYGTPASNGTGDPQYPFPLLNWAYRPFNNVYELLLVPTVSSSRLLARNLTNPRQYYGYVDGAMRNQTTNPTSPPSYVPTAVYDGSNPAQVPYPHLLNFFESGQSSKAGASAQLHRLFYYVGVPSRFANAQLQMQAVNAGQNGSTHWFHTPFNRISRYREPGMINLNTVTSPDVLLGAMNTYSLLAQNEQLNPVFWDKFVRSRRGDLGGTPVTSTTGSTTQQSLSNMFQISGNGPSRFMRPYRTPGGAYLTGPSEPARETDVTFLRADPDVLSANSTTARPLYEVDDLLATTVDTNSRMPDQFGVKEYPPNGLACMDFNRGPNFRYQLIQKLGSTASTHSNVFAIWITVGYFEVLPCAVDQWHQDGYQLGAELGSDTGDITRHRAFYIFDRSLPVGYIRGRDINTDKAFLLKRFTE